MGKLERVPGKQNWIEHLPAATIAAWHRSTIYRAVPPREKTKAQSYG